MTRYINLLILMLAFGCQEQIKNDEPNNTLFEVKDDYIYIKGKRSVKLAPDELKTHPVQIIADNNTSIYIFDGFRFIYNYSVKTGQKTGTFTSPYRLNTKDKVELGILNDQFIYFKIGLGPYLIIPKASFDKYLNVYDEICERFESEDYDTYNFFISEVVVSDCRILVSMKGEVRQDTISFGFPASWHHAAISAGCK